MSQLGSATHHTGPRLAREWNRLRTRPDALLRAAGWGLIEGPVTDLDQVLTAVGFETSRTPDVEQGLRRLVVIAGSDELAARVLVQRLLPGLLAVVRRRRRGGYGDTVFDELLATLWISIRTYNPNRNPTCIAAALISDADYRAFRSARRRRSATERPVAIDDSTIAASELRCASDELDELFSEALDAGVDHGDIELLRQLVDAPRAIDLARQLNVTPRTIRNRRDRITGRLREVVLAA
jgi:DNA-directed RNA polymerase specialized sigma24 family protein